MDRAVGDAAGGGGPAGRALIRLPSPMPQPDYAYHGSYNVNSYEDELLKVYGLPDSFVLENARPEEIEADPTIIALPR